MLLQLESLIDTLALVYAILFFPVPVFWLIIHPAIRFWRRFGKRSYWVALPLWVLSGMTFVLLRDWIFAQRMTRNLLTGILGVFLGLLGTWIGYPVHRELGLRRLAGFPEIDPVRYAGGIIRSGVYAYIRHPRYLGLMLTFFGLALLTGGVGYFLLAIVTILLYQFVAPLEERELRERYGPQYDVYAREVPRFLPRLGRSPKHRTTS